MSVQPVSRPEPPLPSRLAPPWRRSAPIARPRLLQRLTSAADAPVFVVRAPAGYGKSTLLAQFAAMDRRTVAWLALDERDDDPAVLIHDLAHALRSVAPMSDDVLAALTPNPASVLPVAVPQLLHWLDELDEPLVLVVDDVHLLLRDDTRDVLRVLSDGAPAGTTVVLAGRAKPPIALARLRAEGRLSEVGAADLRMTAAEGTAMLRAAGAEVADAEGALVVERTEGWPAAIYLAALMLRGERSALGSETLGPSEADIREYIREEVLAEVDPVDSGFLLRSSILDGLDAALCDVVLERDDSAERLRGLADADLFVTAADVHGEQYRVHGLFREILQVKLRARLASEVPGLHARASAAYAERGDAERAVRHALAAGDTALAAEHVWAAATELVSHGRSTTILRWRSWLTDEQVRAHPVVALAEGWAALEAGDGEIAAHNAAILIGSDPQLATDDGTPLRIHGRLLRATVAEHGIDAAVADAQAAADGFAPASPIGSIALFLLGFHASTEGRREDAAELLGRAEGLCAGVMPTVYSLVLAQQAILAAEVRDWAAAATLSGRATAFQRAGGIEDYATQGVVAAVQALVEAQAGHDAAARRCAEQAARNLALQGSIFRWLALEARLALAQAWVLLGEPVRARPLLAEALEMLERDPLLRLRTWAADLQETLGRASGTGDGPDLTTAELRTLQYLPTHLSLREIGERLYVTRNTVKTHTISIYRKLEVTSRSDAVVRARELGILDA